MLLLWTICGFALGWWANVLFGARAPRRMQPRKAIEATTIAEVLQESRAGLIYERLTQAETPTAEAGQAERRPLPIFAFVVAALLILLLVIEPSWLVECPCVTGPFYAFKALLLSPRVLALLFGTVIGFWASRYREAIGARSGDFYEAFLGSETKSSWALQSMVAIVALLLMVLAIKPDLLERLESFKAGEVEAKFAGVSSATREVSTITNELAKDMTLGQWAEFKEKYLDGSARDAALEFDNSEIKADRKAIRNILFLNYVVPLTHMLNCLDDDRRIEQMRRNPDFVRMALNFRNMILEAKDGNGMGPAFTADGWESLLGLANQQIISADKTIKKDISGYIVTDKCKKIAGIAAGRTTPAEDAKTLSETVNRAAGVLKNLTNEKAYRLSFFDPYFIAAVSDLLALTLGQAEKATFLMQVKAMYPKEMAFIQPGIISVYYYLSDSKLKDESPWPLEETLDELRFAMDGADYIVAETRKIPSAKHDAAAECGEKKLNCYDEILKVYFTNKFIFLNRFLETFDKYSLAGGVLSERNRYEWASFFKQIEAVLNLKRVGPTVDLDFGPSSPIARQDRTNWQNIELAPEYEFDTRVAMALSSVMLTEGANHRSTTQACIAADFYLKEAQERVPKVSANDEAKRARLSGYLAQIGFRVKASCPDRR
jgi:hypothetical protein